MATNRPRRRDRRFSRTIGEKPFVGRRYVENGRVRIEWKQDGKRRRHTVGPNSAATRRQADAELEEILTQMQNNDEQHDQDQQDQQDQHDDQEEQEGRETLPPIGDVLREYALAALRVADGIADWIHEAITSPVEWEWVEGDDEDDGDDGDDEDDEEDEDAGAGTGEKE
jgi:hypothetical protein